MINEFSDAIAVGSDHKVYVFFTRQSKNAVSYKVPLNDRDKVLPTDCIRVAWTLDRENPFEPLLLFSYLSLLYIYNVKKQGVQGYLRGHGGAITSIAVHPIHTNLFCTTSRDYSARIYDLTLKPQKLADLGNPHWPPGTVKSFAGAAHGLHMTEVEGEGNGLGRCIIVLMGGRSGGHQAAVLSAAFNPDFPVIATCGLDRLVKIWHVPRASRETLIREDKPLFSSSRIHKAHLKDYQESIQTQFETPALHLYQSPSHDPVVSFTYPRFNSIKMFNVIHLQPRKPPAFPFDVLSMESGEHLNEDGERGTRSQTDVPPPISGWEIPPVTMTSGEEVLACAMGNEGTTLIGVGSKDGRGAIWIWKL
ncbi:hypothetical protein C0992_006525 [Termitomyces sp. T32_za158]|nr:hypothetical protein C0992_006525 [Termitomyces sp. T32_za158]